VTTWSFGEVEVTRVADPGWELTLPQDDDTIAALQATPWLQPHWVTDDGALRIGSSALLVRAPGAVVLVDPFLAFDDPARFEGRLEALADAGAAPEDVDVVVNSHIDGIGVNVVPADRSPTFPDARYLLGADALAAAERRESSLLADWHSLQEAGVVDLVVDREGRPDPESITAGVGLAWLPGHHDGHLGVEIGEPVQAVIAGHLFLQPAQIANPAVVDPSEGDADLLISSRRTLLDRCAREDLTLIGHLFEAPGGGRVRPAGDAWALVVDATD
jgi:Metallo-beta-lactamase superfamily